MDTIFQDPRDLILGVKNDDNPITQLTVLLTKSLVHRGYDVTFRIIGESHWITLSRQGKIVLQEVLACVKLEHVVWSHEHSFDDGREHQFVTEGYAVSIGFIPFTHAITRLGRGLEHLQLNFPNPLGGEQLPFTRIWWSLSDGSIRWWTIHVYPQEHMTTAVLSVSEFAL
jgi:hypothetical protein